MRDAFSKSIYETFKKDKDTVILLSDLGYTVFDQIEKEFPERVINVGIAEQNMIGVAAGLALMGKKPYVYSIVPFTTLRCLEQIKTDICYHNLNIKIIGIGSGYSYSSAGVTHHAIEDISIMKSLPNMKVACPANAIEVKDCMEYAYNNEGPMYISLAKRKTVKEIEEKSKKAGESSYIILEGNKNAEIAVIASGSILKNAYEACKELSAEGLNVALYSMPFAKPFDNKTMIGLIKRYTAIITVEEHSIIGGIGTNASEIIAENIKQSKCKIIKKMGVEDKYILKSGNEDFYHEEANISKNKIKQEIKNIFKQI